MSDPERDTTVWYCGATSDGPLARGESVRGAACADSEGRRACGLHGRIGIGRRGADRPHS